MRWLFLLLLPTLGSAQGLVGIKNLDRAILVGLGYGPFSSAGDLADRFGNGFSLDASVGYMPPASNWEYGLLAQYGFGQTVKEDVLADLRTSAGFVIGTQRQPAELRLRQRQLFIGPRVGYTLRIGQNQRAGLKLATALGYFQHRIRFQEDPVQAVPQLDKTQQAGYDRLTGGPAVHQFVGYQQLALNRRLNFYVGAEVTAGFTKPLRRFDIPSGGPLPDTRRSDLVLGLRAGLIVPLYSGQGKEIFY